MIDRGEQKRENLRLRLRRSGEKKAERPSVVDQRLETRKAKLSPSQKRDGFAQLIGGHASGEQSRGRWCTVRLTVVSPKLKAEGSKQRRRNASFWFKSGVGYLGSTTHSTGV